MEIKVSKLVDYVFSGNMPKCIKFCRSLYYPDENTKTYFNMYGVSLWAVLIAEVESGTPVSELKLEVVSWK